MKKTYLSLSFCSAVSESGLGSLRVRKDRLDSLAAVFAVDADLECHRCHLPCFLNCRRVNPLFSLTMTVTELSTGVLVHPEFYVRGMMRAKKRPQKTEGMYIVHVNFHAILQNKGL